MFSQLKTVTLLLAIAGLCAPALAVTPAGTATNTAAAPTHRTKTIPSALRPALYRALDEDTDVAYRIGKNDCVTLPKSSLKACFDSHGAHFSGASSLSLHLVAYGRGDKLMAVKPVKPIITGNRVSYRHGALTAWWRVLPMGFEQGFTLAKPPAGHGQLTLELATNRGDPNATSTRHSRGSGNPVNNTLTWGKLRYGRLVVTDASGKIIPSSLKTKGNRIQITVNDTYAVYPLTVDPLVWIEQKVTANDGATGDELGFSVAVNGHTALIGAPNASTHDNAYQGAAYIFTQSSGMWHETQKLTAPDGAAFDHFGESTALDGTMAMVGAPQAGNVAQGAVYVFTKANGNWNETQKLTANDGAASDMFGTSVAVDGTTAMIGAPGVSNGGLFKRGAVYVFTSSDSTWSETKKLTADNDIAGDLFFGGSIALNGATAVIGAPYATINGNYGQGAAYTFTKMNSTWNETQRLTANDGAMYDNFGTSVAVDSSVAMIGAPNANIGNNIGLGAVYVFNNSSGVWTEAQELVPSDGAEYNGFGFSLAVVGPLAVIGAPYTNIDFTDFQGAAYIFTKSGDTWSESQKLSANDGIEEDQFGFSIALQDTTALVGAPHPVSGVYTNPGAAYFYGKSHLGLALSAPQGVDKGQQFVSQTIATNNASAASPAVAVTVAIPTTASFVSATATQGDCSEASGTVTCYFGVIKGNASTATANIKLKATGERRDMILNTASVVDAIPALTASALTTIIINNPPAAQDGTLTTKEDTPASGTLMATDPDGDPLTFVIWDYPSHGSVELDRDNGSYTYTPDQGYSGSDSFTFQANDGRADSNIATISITVKAVNQPPAAKDGTLMTNENTTENGTLMANDPDDDPLIFSIVNKPTHGTVKLDNVSTGAYTYTPNKNYSGSDSFTFKANDGQVNSNVATISITVKASSHGGGGGGGSTAPLGLGLLVFCGLLALLRRKR